ncbi:hypothetical protein V6N13_111296 [Hibiscus sabdariffa]|uniref:Cytochrome c oxidase subunit 1 n=1 Tax=Hibiscus sabdariffa TaxID=183260 RepID=A0ABR2TKE9_9ROSI
MPRCIPDYPDAYAGWNALSSFGSYISVVGICRFFVVVTITSSSGNNKRCAPSPWAVEQNSTTPEWMVQSPPAFHTFGRNVIGLPTIGRLFQASLVPLIEWEFSSSGNPIKWKKGTIYPAGLRARPTSHFQLSDLLS